MSTQSISALIWSIADLLRGDYKQSDYGKVILPFTMIRRLECVLEATRDDVLKEYQTRKDLNIPLQQFLIRKSGQSFYNTSAFTLTKLMSDANNISENLDSYINDFSENAREIFEKYKFSEQIDALNDNNLLYLIVEKFASFDLHPQTISNHQMGLLFEELIRKFAEASNETAGEHFTPRDIVRLTTSLLFINDDEVLSKPSVVSSLYDPTAGTGGFLTSGTEYVHEINADATLVTFGQELNPESYAICKADMMIKGQDVENIKHGNTLSNDHHSQSKFDYMLSNPPFGVEWKKVQKTVTDEHKERGFDGRFGMGLPRVSDGSLLFLMHLISKMRPQAEGGSRIGIILNGSPLFTGGAGSGESEIRRYVLENDLVEAIIAMPNDMFFNTGIATYIWILTNNKQVHRKGKVQLINATSMGESMRKSLGSKRKYLSEEQINEVLRCYGEFEETKQSKLFDSTDFGYRRITVERPLQLSFFPHDKDKLEALQNDKATAKIDTLIEKQTKLIELLKEKRQAVILSAVTRGLDASVPMKDSGVEWLGEIPEHWNVKKLKYVIRTRKGFAFKSDQFQDSGISVVKASDLKNGTINTTSVCLPIEYKVSHSKALLYEGDIVLSTVGSTSEVINSAVGQIGVVPMNHHLSIIKPKHCCIYSEKGVVND